MKKLYIDDKRDIPDETWDLATTSQDAIRMIMENSYDEISFDHDLGMLSEHDGDYIANWIEVQAVGNVVGRFVWHVHSANPVGAARMRQALQRADKFWDQYN